MDNTVSKLVTLYGTPICPMIAPVRNLLKRADVEFTYVDISRDAEAKAVVREVNNGNESVPTLVFADGKTLTEPSQQQLQTVLEQRGYTVAEQTMGGRISMWMQNPAIIVLGTSFLVFGLLRGNLWLLVAGAFLLLLRLVVKRN